MKIDKVVVAPTVVIKAETSSPVVTKRKVTTDSRDTEMMYRKKKELRKISSEMMDNSHALTSNSSRHVRMTKIGIELEERTIKRASRSTTMTIHSQTNRLRQETTITESKADETTIKEQRVKAKTLKHISKEKAARRR